MSATQNIPSSEVLSQIRNRNIFIRQNQKYYTPLPEIQILIVFEDDKSIADKVIEGIEAKLNNEQSSLKVENLEITHIKNDGEITNLLLEDGYTPFFLIDIVHKTSTGNRPIGLDIIKKAKAKFPASFIVAYSTDANYETHACEDAGADLFYHKKLANWTHTLTEITGKIREYFGVETLEYHGKIWEVNDDSVLVHLEDKNNPKETTERYFDKNRFASVGELYINKPVLLRKREQFNKKTGKSSMIIEFESLLDAPSNLVVDWAAINAYNPES
jgi:hypothetical protein